MRVGLARRIASYLIDALPILLLVISMHSLFVGGIIKNSIENYDELETTFNEEYELYNQEIDDLLVQLENEEITDDEYAEQANEKYELFYDTYSVEFNAVSSYFMMTIMYGVITFILVYYVYMLILKGNSFGRKFMGAELVGNVKWYTLFIREVLWKHMFWLIFVVIGNYTGVPALLAIFIVFGIMIDIISIGFSSKKTTLRDSLSGTQVVYKGVNYPF